MALRAASLFAAFPGAAGIACPMLGCDVSGANVHVDGDQKTGVDVSKAVGVQWSTQAAAGQVSRLYCTSDYTTGPSGLGQLLTCGVDRNAPNATGVFGLVGVNQDGSVRWTDYSLAEASGHPVRGRFAPGGTTAASGKVLCGDDGDGMPYGDPRAIEPAIVGGSFSLTSTENEINIVAARGEERLGGYLFNGVPHADLRLVDPVSQSRFRAVGTPVVNGSRVFIIAQQFDASEEAPTCAIFAIDGRRTLDKRLYIAWMEPFLCPPGELRTVTDAGEEVPLVARAGVLFFPGRSTDGRLQLLAMEDAGDEAALRFAVDVPVPGALAIRSLSVVPSDAGPEDLLLGFASPRGAARKTVAPIMARIRVADGSLVAMLDFGSLPTGGFSLASGSRVSILPRGMLLPTASTSEVDIAFVAANVSKANEFWLLAARLGADSGAIETQFAVHLATLEASASARPGIQVVPLDASLVASIGGSLYAVGEVPAAFAIV